MKQVILFKIINSHWNILELNNTKINSFNVGCQLVSLDDYEAIKKLYINQENFDIQEEFMIEFSDQLSLFNRYHIAKEKVEKHYKDLGSYENEINVYPTIEFDIKTELLKKLNELKNYLSLLNEFGNDVCDEIEQFSEMYNYDLIPKYESYFIGEFEIFRSDRNLFEVKKLYHNLSAGLIQYNDYKQGNANEILKWLKEEFQKELDSLVFRNIMTDIKRTTLWKLQSLTGSSAFDVNEIIQSLKGSNTKKAIVNKLMEAGYSFSESMYLASK